MKYANEIRAILARREDGDLSVGDLNALAELIEKELEFQVPTLLRGAFNETMLFHFYVTAGWGQTDHAQYLLWSMNPAEREAITKALVAIYELGRSANLALSVGMPRRFRVIETDNFGGDYPDESWQSPELTEQAANEVAALYNRERCAHASAPRFYRVVPSDYKLQPGFQP